MPTKLAICLRICNQTNTNKFGPAQYVSRVFGMYRVQIWGETPASLIGKFRCIYSFFHRVSWCDFNLGHCIGDVTIRISGTLVAVSLRKLREHQIQLRTVLSSALRVTVWVRSIIALAHTSTCFIGNWTLSMDLNFNCQSHVLQTLYWLCYVIQR